jgi:signal transduction histidine kinase
MTVTSRTYALALPRSPPLLRSSLAAVALAAATVAYAYDASAPGERVESAVIHGLMVSVPAAVGLWALRRRPGDRFAGLLLAAALPLSLTTLAVSSDAVAYSIGRTVVWIVEPGLVYLLLAFPSGRLATTADRAVFRVTIVLAALLYLSTILVVRHFPEPSPWGTCGVSCPRNAFAVTAADPGVVGSVVRPVREVLTVGVFLAVCAVLSRRMARTVPLGRRALAPVLATAALRAITVAAYDFARLDGPMTGLVDGLGTAFLLTLPLIALGFAAGLLAARVYVASALERLTLRAPADTGSWELQAELAAALEDPALRIAYRAAGNAGRWVDDAGRPVAPLRATAERAVTEVCGSGRVVAVEHDPVLRLEPGIVQGAATYALAMLENERLVAAREAQLRELAASRARIVSVGDQARRRIERDLHDGAQQRLVALRTVLALESERVSADSSRLGTVLAQLGDDVEETIDEVRSIARGLYPSLLAERGLGVALRAAARVAPLATSVEQDGIGRYTPELETTIYFVCVEAMQNAVKHARGASGVRVSLADDGRLRFEVRDDGVGFAADAPTSGSGLTNLRDRVAAVGGVLTVETSPGAGTRIAGAVPVPAGARRTRSG